MRDLLEIAGRRDVPVRSESAHLIESTVAQQVAPGSTSGAADELESRRERRRQLPAVLSGAAAAVVALLVAGALTGLFGSGPADDTDGRTDLALVTAVDTVVVLPDGSTVAGARGVALPDGTIIRTGPHGRATVAGVRLGPDSEAVVRDGRVRVLEAEPGTVPADGGTTGSETPAVPDQDGSSGGTTSGGPSTGGTSSGDDGGGPSSSPPSAPNTPPPVIVPPLPLPTLPSLDDVLPLG
jgi:uncharacterized membrane protein YgcG